MTVWFAYYTDGSSIGVFETELEALRHAVQYPGMKVKEVTLPCEGVIQA